MSHQFNTERLFDLLEIAGLGKVKGGSLGIPQILAKQKKVESCPCGSVGRYAGWMHLGGSVHDPDRWIC